MKNLSRYLAFLLLLSGSAAFAQQMAQPVQRQPGDWRDWNNWRFDVSAPYAFKAKTLGVSAAIGPVINSVHFVGLEATYFRPTETDYTTNGFRLDTKESITTLLAAYKLYIPLKSLGMSWLDVPASFYIGGGLGAGFVKEKSTLSTFGTTFQDHSNGKFASEAQAGFEWPITSHLGLKVGYRYYNISRVKLFGSRGNIHDNLAEAGLSWKY